MTMKTPEMEVVRFSESDVIVASGEAKAVFQGFNDGKANTATINGNSVQSYTQMIDLLGGESDSWFRYGFKDPVHASNLLKEEETGNLGNGTYVDQGRVTIGETTYERLWWNQ